MTDCIFCKIINGEIKQDKVYEDKDTIVILDISPASEKGGHCLVMPKKHYELFSDIPEKELCATAKTLQKTVSALMKYGEGVNILQNNKKIAGQYINHVHFHVIPRFKDDNITIEKWTAHRYKDGDMDKISSQIKALFPK